MCRSLVKRYMVSQSACLEVIRVERLRPAYSTIVEAQNYESVARGAAVSLRLYEEEYRIQKDGAEDVGKLQKLRIGENILRKDKYNFLLKTLFDLKDNKEAVYGALAAWVAWELSFPIGLLRRALIALEKNNNGIELSRFHSIKELLSFGGQSEELQKVIKWMLSKGQGNKNGMYTQLIKALDMDHRAEEAHRFWVKKINKDLHSVPWQLCSALISIYYRNNMLDNLVMEYFQTQLEQESLDRDVVTQSKVPPPKLLMLCYLIAVSLLLVGGSLTGSSYRHGTME